MEIAHSIVQKNVDTAMRRQNRYDNFLKLSWQTFEKEDEMYVYFLSWNSGCPPKFYFILERSI